MDRKYVAAITFISLLYLFLRLIYPGTIEFGYDQPRLATRVLEYIQNGKVFETQKFAEVSPWGNISWGPSLFYFYAPFLLLTKNPLLVSQAISVFNLISILAVVYVCWKYFSKPAAIIAGIFLVTHPWWLIFSRMIYQPTAILSAITISMALFFKVKSRPNSFWLSLLIFSWAFLIGLYVHSSSFVLVSALYLVVSLKKSFFNKFFLLGIFLSSLIVIPFLIHFSRNAYVPERLGSDGIRQRIVSIAPGFMKAVSGGALEYQLGYGYDDFYENRLFIKWFEKIAPLLILFVLIYNLFKKRFLLLLWTISPLVFLTFMPLPNVPPIPRYFLIGIPSLSILFGFTLVELIKKSKIFLVLLLLLIGWILVDLSYYDFIENYDYPKGHLSTYSDTPFLFLFNAFERVIADNRNKGRGEIVISSDEDNPTSLTQDWATRYLWDNVFKLSEQSGESSKGYYVIDYSIDKSGKNFTKIGRFGPYSVYEFKDL